MIKVKTRLITGNVNVKVRGNSAGLTHELCMLIKSFLGVSREQVSEAEYESIKNNLVRVLKAELEQTEGDAE